MDHGVLAVGFGSKKSGKNKDYYIVKNSWGIAWGEDGYIRIARGTSTTGGMCGIANYPSYAIA